MRHVRLCHSFCHICGTLLWRTGAEKSRFALVFQGFAEGKSWHGICVFIKNKTGCGTQMTVPVCWRSRTHGDKSKEWEAITMKYAVLSGNERFEIREGELKSNGCAVLQVTHVGVCGTDTSYWHEGERYRGVVIGHEYSGVVVAPGTNRALKPGDRVAGYTQNVFQEPCGHCEACLAGDWDH